MGVVKQVIVPQIRKIQRQVPVPQIQIQEVIKEVAVGMTQTWQRQVEEVVVQETFKEVIVAMPEPVVQTVVAAPVTTATIAAPQPNVYQGGTVTVQAAPVQMAPPVIETMAAPQMMMQTMAAPQVIETVAAPQMMMQTMAAPQFIQTAAAPQIMMETVAAPA